MRALLKAYTKKLKIASREHPAAPTIDIMHP